MVILILSIITCVTAILTAVLVVFKRYQRLTNTVFFISMFSTSAVIFGDSVSIYMPDLLVFWKRSVLINESIMVTSWLLFTLSFAREDSWNSVNNISKIMMFLSPLLMIFSVVIPMERVFYSPEFASEKILFLDNAGYIFNFLLLLYSVISIMNMEATLKSSSEIARWQIKYVLIGSGGIIAVNIFYYSYALLYRSINMNLLPVRAGVVLISVLLIGFAIFKHKAMNVKVTVSRKVVYKSISLIIVGAYLLGLGILSEGMRYLGPEVGRNITTFLGFVGAILVLTIILSERLRRKAIVLINKNFYSQKYDYREQWLQFTQQISLKHTFDELLKAIAGAFKEAIGSRGVSVWLKEKDNGKYQCVEVLGAEIVTTSPNKELVEFLQNRKWVLNVSDDNCRAIVLSSYEFIEKTRASLIVPFLHMDRLVGFIILREALAKDEYNFEDYDLLKTLARQAALSIMNAKLSEELIEAKEMEAMGRLSSFIIHDLKNAASMLSLLAQNAEEHIDNPDFQRDAIRSVSNTSEKIKGIIGKLKNLPVKRSLDFENCDLGLCVKTAISELNLNGNSRLSYTESEHVKAKMDKNEIIKVIVNLIINAFDAAGRESEVKVSVGEEDGVAFIKVSDKGCGMSAEFIEKCLFKPFQTTKKKGLGIGLYQCKTIIEAHSGRIRVFSQEGKGTDFIVNLPLTK
ncbi:MAG: PEP-CTERM system histidine kinase PrsK [Nitrospirae bacterium]|nr:PEP-CTERM system histidine kinase PrsK [Nitrospirota bacterium]MBI4849995.1 PEP-CTERM system histidine kinase PrsK [Nitrospirota bacterium]